MKYILLLIFPLVSYADNNAGTKIHCDYSFMGMQLSTAELNLAADGTPDTSVLVTMIGATQPSTFTSTPETVADSEMTHIWISKEQPDGAIEMIVYKVPTDNVQSKLINHNVPFGQEMTGPCTFTPIEASF